MPDRRSGFCCRYSVEKTAGKGLGVFAREAVEKGSVVWRHVPGLYAVYDECRFHEMVEGMSHGRIVYELMHCFGLADFPGCIIRVFDDGELINHSSSANLFTNNAAPASV